MGKVRDLTSDCIGKVYRIQNDDGAFIEGTLDAVTFGLTDEKSNAIDVIVSFKELKTSWRESTKRDYIRVYTKPQHEATEIDEDARYGAPESVNVMGPKVNRPE